MEFKKRSQQMFLVLKKNLSSLYFGVCSCTLSSTKQKRIKGDTQRDTEGVLKDNAYIVCIGLNRIKATGVYLFFRASRCTKATGRFCVQQKMRIV